MGEDAQVELIRGVLRERPAAGGRHGLVGGRFTGVLGRSATEHGLGAVVSSGTGFVLERFPTTLLVPDVALVDMGDFPSASDPDWFIEGLPKVAVDIHSSGCPFGEHVKRVELT